MWHDQAPLGSLGLGLADVPAAAGVALQVVQKATEGPIVKQEVKLSAYLEGNTFPDRLILPRWIP